MMYWTFRSITIASVWNWEQMSFVITKSIVSDQSGFEYNSLNKKADLNDSQVGLKLVCGVYIKNDFCGFFQIFYGIFVTQ